MEEETREQRLARYRELVNDPVAKAVANLIQPNQAEKFDEQRGLELMEKDSAAFARLMEATFEKVNIQ